MSESEKDLKNQYIVSLNNKDVIIDTTVSKGKTSFSIFNKKSRNVTKKDHYIHDNIRYLPIKSTSNLLTTGTLLLREKVEEYGTKDKLLDEIQGYIYDYVDIPKNYKIITSYYVLLTYLYENFSEVPYLRVIGDYGSGKSRFLKVVSSICYNSILTTGGTSPSALFRTINNVKGTLMLDEADFGYSGTEAEIIKLLNNGYQKGFSLMKADGERFDVNTYYVFGPKIIGGRYEFKDKATESRCLVNRMERSSRNIPTGLDKLFIKRSLELRNKLIKFRFDYFDKIQVRSDYLEGIEPRLSQIINPILSIVDSKSIEDLIIESLKEKQNEIKEDRKNSIFGGILLYIKEYCKGKDEFNFGDIINALDSTDGRHNISPRKLGSIFKQHKLKTTRKREGTILSYTENYKELERLYKEYGIK